MPRLGAGKLEVEQEQSPVILHPIELVVPLSAFATPPSRCSTVCGTYHVEMPGPVAMAGHTSSAVPTTSTSNSIFLASTLMLLLQVLTDGNGATHRGATTVAPWIAAASASRSS